ncbi:hypothetical protein [Enterococcus sp. DIV0660C]|uniref:hypothetical protein n=1 Tax=Enterococcus sp. DIV0660C TaxID=2230880 RepID=UPI001A8ECAF1|nr:hypothetical protein [Enterococcus sp. DIV0660C]MBO0430749.1 hypothetical protein [Enterococcus sp. DIV0660C]
MNNSLNESNRYKNVWLWYLLLMIGTLSLLFYPTMVAKADVQEPLTLDTKILNKEDLPSNVPIEKTLENITKQNSRTVETGILESQNDDRSLRGTTVVGANIIRMSGTTCQLYISWAGTDSINIWRANNIKATNLNLIGPVTYLNMNNYYKTTTASPVGTSYVGTMSIPTKVSATNLQAYYLSYGWRSGIINNGTVVIN